jgi:hypothetical protein
LVKVLRAIQVKIPGSLVGADKEVTQDLFTLAYNNRDTLVSGVTNAMNASEAETFFFYNVIPKLQAHGLAENQREAGFKFRRGFLNKQGQLLFAEAERKALLARSTAKPPQTPPVATSATAAPTAAPSASRKAVSKSKSNRKSAT